MEICIVETFEAVPSGQFAPFSVKRLYFSAAESPPDPLARHDVLHSAALSFQGLNGWQGKEGMVKTLKLPQWESITRFYGRGKELFLKAKCCWLDQVDGQGEGDVGQGVPSKCQTCTEMWKWVKSEQPGNVAGCAIFSGFKKIKLLCFSYVSDKRCLYRRCLYLFLPQYWALSPEI